MPPPPQPRSGRILRIKDRPLEFSFWPMERTTRRYGLGTRVFASDPWTVIRRSIDRRASAATQDAAFALMEQAEDFFRAAESGVKAANPLLLYYCFMNLAKAYILATQQRSAVDYAAHGLSEKLDPPGTELSNAWLEARRSVAPGPLPAARIQLFDEFQAALTGAQIPTPTFRYDLPTLISQVVPGHRLWVAAEGSKRKERFVSLDRIEFRQDTAAKEIWLCLYLFADDLKRINHGHQELINHSRLGGLVHEVACNEKKDDRSLICLEQDAAIAYGHRPADQVQTLVNSLKHKLWRTVLIAPPYRKYYLYPAPPVEHPQVVPQIISIYAVTFYLGSIVRYRPHHFDRILDGPYGAFIEAFLNDQPSQFVYLMASEFAEKEVTKAAIV